MPANNSKTNRNIRRAAALERFSSDPAKATNADYIEAKKIEKEALGKPDPRQRIDRKRGAKTTITFD